MPSEITPQRESAITPMLDLGPAIMAATELGKDGVEVLERLHAIQKEERAAAAKAAFVRDMNRLREKMEPVEKTVEGAHGVRWKGTREMGKYAPLDTITPKLDPLCAEFGFIYDFDREVVPGRPHDYMVCIVTHRDGHEKRTRYPAPDGPTNKGTNSLMAIGIGESYAKRYALIAAFGITTADPDTDADYRGAAKPGDELTDEQVNELDSYCASLSEDRVRRFLAFIGVEELGAIPARRFGESLGLLKRAVKQEAAKGAK